MPPNPHTAQAKALRQTKPARPGGLFFYPAFMTSRPLCQPIMERMERREDYADTQNMRTLPQGLQRTAS